MNLTRATTIAEAVKVLEQGEIDFVLSGHQLSDGNGLDLLGTLDRKGIATPLAIITAHGNEMIASELIQAGAYDYLTKEMLNRESISQCITSVLKKARLKREIRLARERMAEMATRDELTGLHNRRYFLESLEREMARARRYETDLMFCMSDLDHFNEINDTFGHAAGDMALSEIGKILKQWARQTDLPCRYGGDEFAVILPNTDAEGGLVAGERLREAVAGHRFEYEAHDFQMTISIGIALYNRSEEESPADLVKRADAALYRAKEGGRNRVVGSETEI